MIVGVESYIPTLAASTGSTQMKLGFQQNIEDLVGSTPAKGTDTMMRRSSKEAFDGQPYTNAQCRSVWYETVTLPIGKLRCHTVFAQALTKSSSSNENPSLGREYGGGDDDDDDKFDWNTSMWVVPSSWLLKIGLSRVFYIALSRLAHQGWKSSFRTFNARNSNSTEL